MGSLYNSRGFNLIQKLAKIDKTNNYYLYGSVRDHKKFITKNLNTNLYINDYVTYRKIPKILKKMDIFIMPYVSTVTAAGDVGNITKYTSPLKLFDYLSAGRVIICSNLDVLKEILSENKNAIFIKNFKNVFAWKLEIKKLVNQKNKIMIMSMNNYKHSKKYSHFKRGQKILNIIESNINNVS